MNPTTTLDSVHTRIPPSLARLSELSLNIWWSWTVEARQLFETIDPTLWFYTHHNPVKLLTDIKPERLTKLANDPSYLRQYSAVLKLFDEYKANGRSWFSDDYESGGPPRHRQRSPQQLARGSRASGRPSATA